MYNYRANMNDLNLCMLSVCVFFTTCFVCCACFSSLSFLCICSTLASFLLLVSMFSRGEIGVGAVGVRLVVCAKVVVSVDIYVS